MSLKTALPIVLLVFALDAHTTSMEPIQIGSPAQKPPIPNNVVQRAKGMINGEKYTALITNDNGTPDFLLLKGSGQNITQISKIELVGDLDASHVEIKGNSFYLRTGTAHHGVYFATYQFDKMAGKFFLVGIETQSMTSCAYSEDPDEAENTHCRFLDMWAGTSIDFLTSKAECWLQNFNLDKDDQSKDWNKWLAAMEAFKQGKRSKHAINRNIDIPYSALVALNQFDLYNFHSPTTCYFDYKGGFHKS